MCLAKEKDLIHKLFKVLVPRYQNYETSFTQMWNLPIQYPGRPIPLAVLELKGEMQLSEIITGSTVVQYSIIGRCLSHFRRADSDQTLLKRP